MLEAFSEILGGSLSTYVSLSAKIGGPVKDQASLPSFFLSTLRTFSKLTILVDLAELGCEEGL